MLQCFAHLHLDCNPTLTLPFQLMLRVFFRLFFFFSHRDRTPKLLAYSYKLVYHKLIVLVDWPLFALHRQRWNQKVRTKA